MAEESHRTFILDVPRDGLDRIPYPVLEQLKNGLWQSAKYMGKRVYREEPANLLIFANDFPLIEKLSIDRWDIYEIMRKTHPESLYLEERNAETLLVQ